MAFDNFLRGLAQGGTAFFNTKSQNLLQERQRAQQQEDLAAKIILGAGQQAFQSNDPQMSEFGRNLLNEEFGVDLPSRPFSQPEAPLGNVVSDIFNQGLDPDAEDSALMNLALNRRDFSLKDVNELRRMRGRIEPLEAAQINAQRALAEQRRKPRGTGQQSRATELRKTLEAAQDQLGLLKDRHGRLPDNQEVQQVKNEISKIYLSLAQELGIPVEQARAQIDRATGGQDTGGDQGKGTVSLSDDQIKKILQDNGMPVTPANIAEIRRQAESQ